MTREQMAFVLFLVLLGHLSIVSGLPTPAWKLIGTGVGCYVTAVVYALLVRRRS